MFLERELIDSKFCSRVKFFCNLFVSSILQATLELSRLAHGNVYKTTVFYCYFSSSSKLVYFMRWSFYMQDYCDHLDNGI